MSDEKLIELLNDLIVILDRMESHLNAEGNHAE